MDGWKYVVICFLTSIRLFFSVSLVIFDHMGSLSLFGNFWINFSCSISKRKYRYFLFLSEKKKSYGPIFANFEFNDLLFASKVPVWFCLIFHEVIERQRTLLTKLFFTFFVNLELSLFYSFICQSLRDKHCFTDQLQTRNMNVITLKWDIVISI